MWRYWRRIETWRRLRALSEMAVKTPQTSGSEYCKGWDAIFEATDSTKSSGLCGFLCNGELSVPLASVILQLLLLLQLLRGREEHDSERTGDWSLLGFEFGLEISGVVGLSSSFAIHSLISWTEAITQCQCSCEKKAGILRTLIKWTGFRWSPSLLGKLSDFLFDLLFRPPNFWCCTYFGSILYDTIKYFLKFWVKTLWFINVVFEFWHVLFYKYLGLDV